MTHTVVIDLSATPYAARAAAGQTASPSVHLKHLTTQSIAFAFATAGTIAAVTGWVEGRVVLKETPTGDVLLLDAALAESGADLTKRYTATWAAADNDSDALRTFLATSKGEALTCWAEIQWEDGNGTHAVAFEIEFEPSFNLDTDGEPDLSDPATDVWLADRAVRYDQAQDLSNAEKEQALSNIGLTGIRSIAKTALGYLEFTDTAGNLFHVGLNAGAAPTE